MNNEQENKENVVNDYWYVLRTRIGSEGRVCEALASRLDSDLYLPFVPTKKYPFRLKKEDGSREVKQQDCICFPGYVFVRSQEERFAFIRTVSPALELIKGAHFFIYYGTDKQDIVMRQHERRRIDMLMDKAFNIGVSKGFVEGDSVTIIDGPLFGLEGIIARVDRHKHMAIIKTAFMGDERAVSLMLEVVEKSNVTDAS